ncbi:MAG: hypothetical protein ACRECG_09025 [Bradyrhizobium sp.]
MGPFEKGPHVDRPVGAVVSAQGSRRQRAPFSVQDVVQVVGVP